MVEINTVVDKFIRDFNIQVGVKGVSEKELLKIMKYFDVIKNDETEINTKEISSKYKIDIVQDNVFMTDEKQFENGQTVYVCKKKAKSSALYAKRKRGHVVGIYDAYVIIKFDNYNESILYNCMDIGEYLIFNGGKKK